MISSILPIITALAYRHRLEEDDERRKLNKRIEELENEKEEKPNKISLYDDFSETETDDKKWDYERYIVVFKGIAYDGKPISLSVRLDYDYSFNPKWEITCFKGYEFYNKDTAEKFINAFKEGKVKSLNDIVKRHKVDMDSFKVVKVGHDYNGDEEYIRISEL